MTEKGVIQSWEQYQTVFAGSLAELSFALFVLNEYRLMRTITIVKELGGYTIRGERLE